MFLNLENSCTLKILNACVFCQSCKLLFDVWATATVLRWFYICLSCVINFLFSVFAITVDVGCNKNSRGSAGID